MEKPQRAHKRVPTGGERYRDEWHQIFPEEYEPPKYDEFREPRSELQVGLKPPPTDPEKESFQESFKLPEGPRYHDLWAAILFVLVFAGFIAISAIALEGNSLGKVFEDSSLSGTQTNVSLSTNTLVLFGFILLVSLSLGLLYFWTMTIFTKQIIWIVAFFQTAFGLGTAIYYFIEQYYSSAIVFLIFALAYVICFISWKSRIPFSVLLLTTSIDVAKKFGHVFLVSIIGGVVGLVFAAWWSITLIAIYAKWEPSNNAACVEQGDCSSAKVIGLTAYITFAAYWFGEVLKNVMHVTVSGVYGSWYFCSRRTEGIPRGITQGAFKRSMTYSFGSISCGSLLVSIVQFLRQSLLVAKQSVEVKENTIGKVLVVVLGLLLSILDWIIEFINEYAFSYIALYGKGYFPAAKATWHMMRDRGIDALVNECLINPALSMGCVFVAYVCAFLAYLYIDLTNPAYNTDGAYTPLIMAFAFLIGLQISNIFLVPIKSGITTLFVAMAFDPGVLTRDFPELYQQLITVYPKIQAMV